MTATYCKCAELFKCQLTRVKKVFYRHILRRWGHILLFSSLLNAVSLGFNITFTDFV